MPKTKFEGQEYDCMAVCVDRLSGWTVVTPHKRKGLTAKVVAKEMFTRWFEPFGLPTVVTSDQGPQFSGAWWQTMCGCMGIRSAKAQAYHHQANGRAEVQGKEFKIWLRKLCDELDANWVEILPLVRRKFHNIPGQSGLSPYEIVFGRNMPLAGLPLPISREAEEASDFFARMSKLDEEIAEKLNALHLQRFETLNSQRAEKPILNIGQKVWFLRPANLESNLKSRWLGPCEVRKRTGQDSYEIEVKTGIFQNVHITQLKIHLEDRFVGKPLPLNFYQGEAEDLEATPGEYVVEKFLSHRKGPNGQWQFLVKWKGWDESDNTWEPIGHFFHRYAREFFVYAEKANLKIDLMSYFKKRIREGVI
jgi:hypothetical protein